MATAPETAPDAISACAGWTTHEVVAHLAGVAVEVIRHLEPYLQGDPVPQTPSFEERQAPLQAIDGRERMRSHLTQPDLARLQALLSGY